MYPKKTEKDEYTIIEDMVAMSDSVKLYTYMYTPNIGKQYPIVFIRTPYDEQTNGTPKPIISFHDMFVKAGFAVVCQHCRGTGSSEGICIPYINEEEDGLQTLDYIRTLSFYNGEIYLVGGSYLSTVHLSYLAKCPKDIKGAVLYIQTDRMYFRNYRNGCNYLFCNIGWYLSMIKRKYSHQDKSILAQYNPPMPYKDIMKKIIGQDLPEYTDMLLNCEYNDFWKNDSRTNAVEHIHFPVLFVEGWYDFYIEGMCSMWERLPDDAKSKSAFIIGPWGHGTETSANAEYPLQNANISDDYLSEWLISIREKRTYKYAQKGKVNYYSIGENCWNTSLLLEEKVNNLKLFFCDDGILSRTKNDDNDISYVYNPEKRHGCFKYNTIFKAQKTGFDPSIISFETEAFEETISFYGKINCHMNVKSDCEDTAFFIRIYFVENGEAYNLTETITSISHICKDYIPGDKLAIDIDTPPIAFTVKKGNKIRVDISSDGGIYVPHSNVRGHWAEVEEKKIAHNTLCLKDSYIILP